MDDGRTTGITQAITEAGLTGIKEPELLQGFCRRLVEEGLPLSRGQVVIDTLHPVHEGRVFRWWRDGAEMAPIVEYGRTSEGGEVAENWRRSPYRHLLETGGSSLRRRIGAGHAADFPVLEDLREQGHTDLLILIHRFAAD